MGIERIAEFITETDYSCIPKEAVHTAKQGLLDFIGVTIAGLNEPVTRIIVDRVREMGAKGEAGIIGNRFMTTADLAAWANGTISHSIDYDDISPGAAGFNMHPSVPILPAVLALGQKHHLSGKDILTAYVLGVEIESLLGSVIGRKNSDAGWHPTPVLGAVGAAAACAKMLKLGNRETAMALGIVASLTCGIMSNVGTMTKPVHAGNAARNGVLAGELAQKGFTGNQNIYEGKGSFCRVFSGGEIDDLGGRESDLGHRWDIISTGIAFKPYPSCRGTHASIDATLKLRNEHKIEAGRVTSITCKTSPRIINLRFPQPHTGYQGKFSMPYCVATALIKGRIVLDDFTDKEIANPEIQDLLSRIHLVQPRAWITQPHLIQEVTIKTKDGEEYSCLVTSPKGEPKNPMTDQELIAKFSDCTKLMLKVSEQNQLADTILNIERVDDISGLVDGLTNLRSVNC